MRNAGISLQIFSWLALLALLLLLVPMLKAAEFDVPSADDFSYGMNTHMAWEKDHSAAAVLKAAAVKVRSTYYKWQGTFSAIFLFAVNPMIFGEEYYRIGPWMILGMLLIGIFVLTETVFRKLFGASQDETRIIAVVWAVLCTQFLPRASQGIYWYNGAVYYTFFFGLACVAYALLLRYIIREPESRGAGLLTAASLLLFFIGGGNLVTGLTTAVLLVSMEVILVLMKRREWKPLLIPCAAYFAAFIINVIAPGNAARQKKFVQPGAVRSVFISFQQAGIFSVKWFTLPVIALILLLIPVFLRISRRTAFRFRMPLLVTLYSVCLSGVMFYPPIYAMTAHNLDHLGRIINIIYFGMVFLVIFNLFYWLGWLVQRGSLPERLFPVSACGRYSLIYLMAVLLVFSFGMTRIKWFDTTSISAFRSYRSGEMGNYRHTYRKRLEILKDPEVKDAVLKRFPVRPYVLFYQELSPNPHGNGPVARWYGKDTVMIQ